MSAVRRRVPRGAVALGPAASRAHQELCQACHRIIDRYQAGEITIAGGFVAARKDEIIHLARHQEKLEKAEHPLHRIMTIDEENGALVVRTTDIHLPRRIGEALRHAYHGELDFHYDEEGSLHPGKVAPRRLIRGGSTSIIARPGHNNPGRERPLPAPSGAPARIVARRLHALQGGFSSATRSATVSRREFSPSCRCTPTQSALWLVKQSAFG
jgi:hypothetical protein